MAGYCDNFSMIDGNSSNFSMIDGGDKFKAFPGLKGEDGTTFYPHVSAEGVLSWTNDGGKPNPDPVNIKGADGKSAYEAAVEAGFTGTESEFNEYLSGIGDLTALTDRKAGMLVDTASGAIASFVPDSTIDNLLGVSVDIEPVQSGSGDPSPDNVRPISGWSAVGILATGVNVWDEQWENGHYDGTTGAPVYYPSKVRNKNPIPVLPNTTYFIVTPVPGTNVFLYDQNMHYILERTLEVTQGNTLTTPANAYYMNFSTFGSTYTTYNHDISINYPSTDHDYHAYSGNTYTIALGQTVYGCRLTIDDDGSVTALVDRAIVTYADSTGFVAHYSNRFYHNGLPTGEDHDRRTEAISNQAKYGDYQNVYEPYFSFGSTGVYINKLSADETLAQFSARLSANPFQICYYLAAPIEIQLDPVTISTIAGQTNNVWSDAGDVSVEFAADIKAYIDRLNQPTEDDMIANSLIASGKYFTVNNRLFLSTASIAAGAQIIPGHNCTETSLVEALNALNA